MADNVEQSDAADQPAQPVEPIDALIVVDDDVFDRLGSVIRHLCVGLIDESVRATVLSRSAGRPEEDAIGPSRLVHLPRPRWPWSRSHAEPRDVLNILGGNRPAIVHCLSADLAWWARRWVEEWDCALVVHLTDLVDVRRFVRLRPGRRTVGIAVTPSIQRALLDRNLGLEDQVRMVPLGIPAHAEPACMAQPERVPAVLMTLPLTRDCGLPLVLNAIGQVVRAGRDVHLFVLAAGPGERLFRRLVQRQGLRSHVTFTGGFRDWAGLREAIAGGDIYVLPHSRHRFAVTTLTAMAAGLAVLAPTGTIGDYLIDGKTASLFDPQKPGEMAEKLDELLGDPEATRGLAQGAQDYIRSHHKASAMIGAVAGVYRQLSPAPSAPQSTG